SPDFLRNRVRRELMPLLEADYSPTLRRHLLRLARLAAEETALLDELAGELLDAASMRSTTSHHQPLRLSRPALLDAPPALARRALRLAAQVVQPGPPPELATVERLLALAHGERPGFTLPGGRIAARGPAAALIPVRGPRG